MSMQPDNVHLGSKIRTKVMLYLRLNRPTNEYINTFGMSAVAETASYVLRSTSTAARRKCGSVRIRPASSTRSRVLTVRVLMNSVFRVNCKISYKRNRHLLR